MALCWLRCVAMRSRAVACRSRSLLSLSVVTLDMPISCLTIEDELLDEVEDVEWVVEVVSIRAIASVWLLMRLGKRSGLASRSAFSR